MKGGDMKIMYGLLTLGIVLVATGVTLLIIT